MEIILESKSITQILSEFHSKINSGNAMCSIQSDDGNRPFAGIKPVDNFESFIENIRKSIEDENPNLSNTKIINAVEWDNGYNITITVSATDMDMDEDLEENEEQEKIEYVFELFFITVY